MFSGALADLAALAALNISDPKGDGSVSLPLEFPVMVVSPGNNSPPAWFFLRSEPSITTLTVQNWAAIASGRTGSEAWISNGPIVATENTSPNFTPPSQYAGVEWRSKFTDAVNGLEWIEKWIFTGSAWSYLPSVIEAIVFPAVNPAGRGSMYYEGTSVYIANYDLSGWSLLTTTSGIS